MRISVASPLLRSLRITRLVIPITSEGTSPLTAPELQSLTPAQGARQEQMGRDPNLSKQRNALCSCMPEVITLMDLDFP